MKVNSNLEAEFNLAPMSLQDTELPEPVLAIEKKDSAVTLAHYEKIDKIAAALPMVEGLDSTDQQLDELAELAIQAHRDLMELSMNVEQRFTGEVASAAGAMLGHAVAARTNKIKKKLDMISLQIKKQVADQRAASNENQNAPAIEGQGMVLDRNELLDRLLAKTPQK